MPSPGDLPAHVSPTITPRSTVEGVPSSSSTGKTSSSSPSSTLKNAASSDSSTFKHTTSSNSATLRNTTTIHDENLHDPPALQLGDESDGHRASPPRELLSPAFTPPATPGTGTPAPERDAKSIAVDRDVLPEPKLVDRLPTVNCVVRARIPTTTGQEMFLHLYENDADSKEHLAIVFGPHIRSASLDLPREGETEMDRMIRGAYTGRLFPGRSSSGFDAAVSSEGQASPLLKSLHKPDPSSSNLSGIASAAAARAEVHAGPSSLVDGPTLKEAAILNSKEGVTTHGTSSHGTSSPLGATAHGTSTSTATVAERSGSVEQLAKQTKKEHQLPLVRIHSECYTGETVWSARCDCGEQLDEAARLMSLPSARATGGVIIYLRQEGRGIGLGEKLKAYNLQDLGSDTVEANLLLRHPADARSYGLATAMLVDLGLGGDAGIRLLTNNPDKIRALEGPNREVTVKERVAMVPLAWTSGGQQGFRSSEVSNYLQTKIEKMGHMLQMG